DRVAAQQSFQSSILAMGGVSWRWTFGRGEYPEWFKELAPKYHEAWGMPTGIRESPPKTCRSAIDLVSWSNPRSGATSGRGGASKILIPSRRIGGNVEVRR